MSAGITHGCEWFGNMIANAGEKGFSVVAWRDGAVRRWRLVARPFERGDANRIVGSLDTSEHSGVAVAMTIPIRYCPRCGIDLDLLIERFQLDFDRFADDMRRRFPPDGV